MNLDNVSIRKMNHADLETMARWLSTEAVLKFYGDVNSPFSLQQVEKKYGPRIDGDVLVVPFIVELNGAPIGFMQYYKIEKCEQQTFGYPANLDVYGIDQFIGVPSLFNKGLGTIMVKKFIVSIVETTDADLVILDTAISNPRAIRCYEKCGFSKMQKINNGRSWLMAMQTSSQTSANL
ncbi:GNAT family N-acetyltransferase [Planococcus dechangensis]|uniref:GNAT family N-acetyltransferase n=1 Tax=Planococcus dechangensis TaxID=1176255 RepID=A0ABV9MC23_9BACL